MKIFNIYYTYKRNIKTNLLEEYVNFVDTIKKQNKYFKVITIFFGDYFMFVFIFCFFLIIIQNSIHTNIRIIIIKFMYV